MGPGSFQRTPVASPTGHACPLEETEARLRGLLHKVPITRVFDATSLDVLGLPVWCAVTPLALDLTVHAGKGMTATASRISAVMEAIERTSAETLAADRVVTETYHRLSANAADRLVLDPRSFDLPFDSKYHADRELRWVLGYDLITGDHAFVPRDLVVSPATDGICRLVETNGLAAGNCYTEATLHATYEVIERHVVSVARFYDLHHDPATSPSWPVRMIDASTLPARTAGWAERIRNSGCDLVVRDVTSEIEVSVMAAFVVDESFPGAECEAVAFGGYGADVDPAKALFRAVTEAVQSHTGTVLGARDAFEGERATSDRAAALARHVAVLYPDLPVPLPESPTSSRDLHQELWDVVGRLRATGFEHCVVVDLAREDLGVPVVRVLVPGLAPPYGESTRRPSPRLLRRIVG